MKLKLDRKYPKDKYTVGRLYIDGEFFCNTLEDKDRGLTQSMSKEEIAKIKVQDQTAIPKGTYKITLDVVSPRFSQMQFYLDTCNGKLPRLLGVPGFDGILIHVGDGYRGPDLTSGCILVGNNTIVGGLTNGKETFKALYKKLITDRNNLTIEIV